MNEHAPIEIARMWKPGTSDESNIKRSRAEKGFRE